MKSVLKHDLEIKICVTIAFILSYLTNKQNCEKMKNKAKNKQLKTYLHQQKNECHIYLLLS
jgi:hypothetical protein